MHPRSALVLLVVLLAGCSTLGGGTGATATDATLTPAPVPTTETPPAAEPRGAPDLWSRGESPTLTPAPGFRGVEPTCERPPTAVIRIQVLALASNDPATDRGIRTAWNFTVPSVRDDYSRFASRVRTVYEPLLNASVVRLGPFNRQGPVATRQFTTVGPNETTSSYTWILERQDREPYAGCWLTRVIRQHRDQPFGR